VYYGFSEFGVGFGVNRMFLQSGGMRVVEFPDGGRVEIGFPDNVIKNVFWGDMHHVVFGSQSFTDKKNGVRCTITFDPEHRRGLPSDYFEGTVERFDPAKPEVAPCPSPSLCDCMVFGPLSRTRLSPSAFPPSPPLVLSGHAASLTPY